MLQWAVPSFAVVLARAHTLAATLAAASQMMREHRREHSCAVAGWAQVGHDNNVMVEVVEEHYRAGMAVVVAQAFHR